MFAFPKDIINNIAIMANQGQALETAPLPGDHLVSLCSQLQLSQYTIELANKAMQMASVEDEVRGMTVEYGLSFRGGVDGLPIEELANIGKGTLETFLEYEAAREVRAGMEEENDRIKEELFDFSRTLVGSRIKAQKIDGKRDAIYLKRLIDPEGKSMARATGALTAPASTSKLELVPMEWYRRFSVHSIYQILPVDSFGQPQVALSVEG